MRVAVISDTHLRAPTPWFEDVYARHLAPADRLYHCGDHAGYGLWAYLLQHPGFEAVAGNSDSYDLAAELPPLLERDLCGLRLAVTHGWGMRQGLAERIAKAFAGRYDLVFFGHSHAAQDVTIGGTRLVNPGSLSPGGSFALLECEEGRGVRSVRFVSV
ncbi:metallophosphoesterase family protein [Solidesulfovibrio sp.]|jgi:putative phosphoesterase|uniref:metallophosphoesterase family protein n=1 Tax=Solidesulfovibrio sp. TaxID=2910990 RepID=UPI002B1FEC2E|nr:metallophosphoesterase family protein [Solidesulfovibrio sp.]MEA5090070.1 metallophosphoesterase family protein [Solidesulfovibrio sp.]